MFFLYRISNIIHNKYSSQYNFGSRPNCVPDFGRLGLL